MESFYDLIVIGGGTAGCAAAYIAGKSGLKTLLLERSIHLGGAMTSGLVMPVMFTGEHQINTDFYETLIAKMKNIGAQVTYQNNPGWFNPELLKIVLDNLMKDAKVDVIFNANIKDIEISNNKVKSIEISQILSPHNETIHTNNITCNKDKILSVRIGAKYFVDATGNANFSRKINCEILKNNSEFQPMSLRFIMSGIESEKFADWILELDKDRTVTTVQKAGCNVHFSTAYTWDTNKHWALEPVFRKALDAGDLNEADCNYFQVFSIPGMPGAAAFNCPRIVENLNPEDVFDRTKALISARESIFRLSEFCKKYLPGFENAYISNIADELGVRVSNCIKGKYIYTIEDLKSGKKFDNPALISNYPVDVHSKDKNASTLEKTGEYQLPVESLMSADYDNLFIVGRCLSADYMAQGALRVQSNCFAMGEAVAKYIASSV